MGLFNRGGGAQAAPNEQHASHHAAKKDRHGARNEPYSMAKRPTFGQWLKYTWLDIVTMICLGLLGLGIYEAHPAPSRSFPITFSDGEIVWPEFGYPLRKEIIPIWAAAMLGVLVPIAIILLMQIRIRSFWDTNNAILGLLYSTITAAVFQVFLKWLIGGLRPHFLDVCKPDLSKINSQNPQQYNKAGFTSIYYTKEVCTGDESQIDDSLESFPSGHTTAAFGGFVYLSLYLNAKLKVFSNYHPALWKLVAVYAPILAATLIGGALTIDEYHNWYDVFAGAVIGTAMAFSAYRMVYAAIWDWRWNHVPLNRGRPAIFGEGMEGEDALFTRKAGWGGDGHHGGHGSGANGWGHGGPGGSGSAVPRKPVGSSPRGGEMV